MSMSTIKDKKILITGCLGLVGLEASAYFGKNNFIIGIDNNEREKLFGSSAGVFKNITRFQTNPFSLYYHYDITHFDSVRDIIDKHKPDIIIHCAGQPSHDLAAKIPLRDFHINANGTLHLLTAYHDYCPEDAKFVFLSTNKVYGDNPNKVTEIVEGKDRYTLSDEDYICGFNTTNLQIDHCLHSFFGVSKTSADLMVQEFGRYYNRNTVCLRAGCITGELHKGAELHGFLSYLIKCIKHKIPYKIYGYKGKQVRDNIHSYDLITAIDHLCQRDQFIGEVYNIGGGYDRSVSIIEVLDFFNASIKDFLYVDEPRKGDHICYYTDLQPLQKEIPNWRQTKSISDIMNQIYEAA